MCTLDDINEIGPRCRSVVKRHVIFVGGVTCSGKSTLCSMIAWKSGTQCQIVHVGGIACELVARTEPAIQSIESLPRLKLEVLQHSLVSCIQYRIQSEQHGSIFVLDGHFVVARENSAPYCLPEIFFTELGVKQLILCNPSASVIRARIESDRKLTCPARIKNSLDYHVAVEAQHARRISRWCKVPLALVQAVEDVSTDAIRDWLVP